MKNNSEYNSDEVNLKELFFVLWNGKYLIILFTLIASLVGVFYSLSLPNTYKSSAVLASASGSSSMSNLASQYSGIASIAGISIPSGEADETAIGLQILGSYNFYEGFVKKYDLLVPLVATTGWNRDSNTLIINPEIYDNNKKKWVSNIPFSVNGRPSYQYSYAKFIEKLSISRDNKTNFITLSFEHYSPFISKKVIELLIIEINEIKRNDDISQAKRSIRFLEDQITTTQLTEVKVGLNALIQNQIETIMLANATPEYLFKVATPPIAPELKIGPNRAFLCILAFVFGGILGSVIVLIRYYASINNGTK
tara:strand:+ start:100 stop:1029 length:930 start_codon:yes stop_codon:yes gene_type:complete